ncbi:MAG: hypothetical protein JSR24_16805 [Proteobacteria bacterium]|nr:hypothetical protein [Pseudomonadota bacterium]
MAGLFGAFWVLSCGLRNKFLYAFAITLCAWAGIVAFTGISLFLQPVQAIIFFVGACLVLLAIHSRMMVAIVVNSYRRRGWQVRAGD